MPSTSSNIFVQLGFSSNIAADTVTSTDLAEGFSFLILSLRAADKSLAAPKMKSTRL